jgi:hypothetical protein
LSFKIILIQKFQISIFRKGINLFEFESVFDLDSNLGFKFKICCKEIVKLFSIFTVAQNCFRPDLPWQPNPDSTPFPVFLPCQPNLLSAQLAKMAYPRPECPSSSSSRTMMPLADALSTVAALRRRSTCRTLWSRAYEA